jgi:hypothetical protein
VVVGSGEWSLSLHRVSSISINDRAKCVA